MLLTNTIKRQAALARRTVTDALLSTHLHYSLQFTSLYCRQPHYFLPVLHRTPYLLILPTLQAIQTLLAKLYNTTSQLTSKRKFVMVQCVCVSLVFLYDWSSTFFFCSCQFLSNCQHISVILLFSEFSQRGCVILHWNHVSIPVYKVCF